MGVDYNLEDLHAYIVPDGPKMLRETLCVAQSTISGYGGARAEEHCARLQRLIDECERKRPTDNAGKHGMMHTPECGCKDV